LRNQKVSYTFVTTRLRKYLEIMRRDVFQAIADPTRRQIIHLVTHHSLTQQELAGHFDVSRPAISKHIRILSECGLITVSKQGRERFCTAKLEQLREVSEWVEQYRKFWTGKLDALEAFLAEDAAQSKLPFNKKSKRK
jgi:DNA-binding transcriptional ArsR family regulator